jgi:hypothetical protein
MTEYESVTEKVSFGIESILQIPKQLQHARLSKHVRCPSFLDSIKTFLCILGLPAPFRCRTLPIS